MALNDVLSVIEDMKAKYNVDADRVYMQGISLGGRGSMEVAALRPELFAAISPQGTYGMMQEPTDIPYYLWQSRWGRWSVARWDFRSYLPNLRHVPMQIVYGRRDRTCPPFHALTYVHMMNKRFGGKAEARGFDTGHHISYPLYKWSDTRAWYLKHKRVRDPSVVTARTCTLRFNRFYWVRIEAMRVQWQMAEVKARLSDETLTVACSNVARLTLEPPKPCKRVTADGREIDLGSGPPPRRLTLACDGEGRWRLVGPEERKRLSRGGRVVKRHGQSGPIWDILHGRCVAVYGAAGSEAETANLERIARRIARLDAAWGEPSFPVIPHTDVTVEQRKSCNLLLVGDARTNPLLAKGKWPFDLERIGEGKGIELFGKVYSGAHNVLMFIYPSPLAAGRYVYVVCPAQPDATEVRVLGPNAGWTTAVFSDWVLVTGVQRVGRRRRRLRRIDGVFDANWRLEKMPGTALRGIPMNWE